MKAPSWPVRPTALPPAWLMSSTTSLFTWPPSTISTTSMVSASVTRMPCTNVALHAEARERGLDLRAAAVHHHRVHADQLEQHHVAREIRLQHVVGHGVAAELDDDGLAVETLDVGQRLAEDARLLGSLGVVV